MRFGILITCQIFRDDNLLIQSSIEILFLKNKVPFNPMTKSHRLHSKLSQLKYIFLEKKNDQAYLLNQEELCIIVKNKVN